MNTGKKIVHPNKTVFDTNIYISALIFGGNPERCLALAEKRAIQLISSYDILKELSATLKNKFEIPTREIARMITRIERHAMMVSPEKTVRVIKADPSDNSILEAAEAAHADYIVSGDKKHLLSIKKFRRTKIVTPAEFLKKQWK